MIHNKHDLNQSLDDGNSGCNMNDRCILHLIHIIEEKNMFNKEIHIIVDVVIFFFNMN